MTYPARQRSATPQGISAGVVLVMGLAAVSALGLAAMGTAPRRKVAVKAKAARRRRTFVAAGGHFCASRGAVLSALC